MAGWIVPKLILGIVNLVAALTLLTVGIAATNWILYTALAIYLIIEGTYYASTKTPIGGLAAFIDLACGISLLVLLFVKIPTFITFPLAILLLIKAGFQTITEITG